MSALLLIFTGPLHLPTNHGNHRTGTGTGGVYSLYLNITGVELLIPRKTRREGRISGFTGGTSSSSSCCGCFLLTLLSLLALVLDCTYHSTIVDDFLRIRLLILSAS